MSRLALASDRRGTDRLRICNPQTWHCRDGRAIVLRPARAADIALARAFFDQLSPLSRYRRFCSARRLRSEELAYLTRTEPRRSMALIATVTVGGVEMQIGAAHYVNDANHGCAELALVIADRWQRLGLGEKLLTVLAGYANAAGLARGTGAVLASNAPMLHLVRKFGAHVRSDPADATLCQFSMSLQCPRAAA